MSALLAALLRAIGAALYRLHLHPLVMWLNRRQPKVLLYHACEEVESDFIRGLDSNTRPSVLARQLDFLLRHYTVVPLAALEEGRLGDRSVVITFDDGYRSVYDSAFPLLRERGLTATVYLVADVVGGGDLVWVNELNWLLRRFGETAVPRAAAALGTRPDASPREIIDAAHARYDAAKLRMLLADIRTAVGEARLEELRQARPYLDWEQIEEMERCGIGFGNHTATHPNLARLAPAEQHEELARGRAALLGRLGACTSVAYPFGDHDSSARHLAVGTGHASVMEVGGANSPLDAHGIARVPIYATSDAGFFAELEVVAPVKAWAARLLRRDRA